MNFTSYTHEFSNITNFPYNRRLVLLFTHLRYARELYISLLKGPERDAEQTTTHSHQSKDNVVKEVIEKGSSEEVASTL